MPEEFFSDIDGAEDASGVFFEACSCGRHGCIASDEEYLTGEMFCRHEVLVAAKSLLRDGIITRDDYQNILSGINLSELPERLDPMFDDALDVHYGIIRTLVALPPPELARGRTPADLTEDEHIDALHEFLDIFGHRVLVN